MFDFGFDDFHIFFPELDERAVVDYCCGVEEGDEFYFVGIYFYHFYFSVDLRDSGLVFHFFGIALGEEEFGCVVAEGADDFRFYFVDLCEEPGSVGADFFGKRVAIFRRATFQDIRDVNVIESQADFF